MKKSKILSVYSVGGRQGFTLTEVLLAVMIVGLIAVALASLTRAAARESGVGRSKIMLRNNLSMFVRSLRSDIMQSSQVYYVGGAASCADSAVALLQIGQNADYNGQAIISSIDSGEQTLIAAPSYITYCFKCGADKENIVPSDATRGGKIYRIETTTRPSDINTACLNISEDNLVLDNVKYISGDYHVPYIGADSFSNSWTNSLLYIQIITELNSRPVVNETLEETFALPVGY